MRRLNLGCGTHHLDGYESIDVSGNSRHVDLSVFPWPWDDGSIDAIMASHILEHFTRDDGRRFMAECHRILVPGGRLDIAVPDLDRFIDARISGDYRPLNGYQWVDLNDLMGGGGNEADERQRHRYMYTADALIYRLWLTGFDALQRDALPIDNPQYEDISLYVTAVKHAK